MKTKYLGVIAIVCLVVWFGLFGLLMGILTTHDTIRHELPANIKAAERWAKQCGGVTQLEPTVYGNTDVVVVNCK